MNKRTFHNGVKGAVNIVRGLAPYDTGNLANDAIKCRFGKKDCAIYVDCKIAPYMRYTNEPWKSPKWHGNKNPNEGWFGKVADQVYIYMGKYCDAQTKFQKILKRMNKGD